MIYSQLIRAFVLYGSSSWSTAGRYEIERLQRKENVFLRRMIGASNFIRNCDIKLRFNHMDIVEIAQSVREKELHKLSLIQV